MGHTIRTLVWAGTATPRRICTGTAAYAVREFVVRGLQAVSIVQTEVLRSATVALVVALVAGSVVVVWRAVWMVALSCLIHSRFVVRMLASDGQRCWQRRSRGKLFERRQSDAAAGHSSIIKPLCSTHPHAVLRHCAASRQRFHSLANIELGGQKAASRLRRAGLEHWRFGPFIGIPKLEFES